jgi:CII-binding regulator of phage lambda lysogenization HflD
MLFYISANLLQQFVNETKKAANCCLKIILKEMLQINPRHSILVFLRFVPLNN